MAAHYSNAREGSHRWEEIPLRSGDIVISAPPKAGTTWLQTISGLLALQCPKLPAVLNDLSPWLDLK
jgi:aryl sulfotransferase